VKAQTCIPGKLLCCSFGSFGGTNKTA